MRTILRRATAVAVCWCALFPATASAQSGDPQRASAAQALYDQATAEMDEGRYASACPRLEEATRLLPDALGAKLALGECYVGLGRLASAWGQYAAVASLAARAGQTERAKKAAELAEALKPKLATLTIVVPPAVRATKGLTITRDGVPVGEAQWDVPLPVDVGAHVIVAAAPGYKPRDARQEILADGVGVQISIAPLERDPRAVVTQKAAFAGPERAWQRPVALSTMAAGAVGVGAGLILGAVAKAQYDASNAENRCDARDRCNEEGLALRNEAIALGNGATVAFVVGTAVLAGGVVLFVTAPKAPETSKAAPRVKASLGLGGFVVRGAF